MITDSSPAELPLARDLPADRPLTVKVIGVGGAGASIIHRLLAENSCGLALAVVDTDQQTLAASTAPEKILIGAALTRGLSTGGDASLGREAALADAEKISALVKERDLVFVVAGLGGGTGGGAAAAVAEAAGRSGALVIALVTLPFSFERGRTKLAEESLRALRAGCDAAIPLPNDILLQAAAEAENARSAFARADEWIGRAVKAVWAMLFRPGLIALDLGKLQQAFASRGGRTLLGLGQGAGPNAVADAIASLKTCPLLQAPEFTRKADRLLVSILGGPALTLPDVSALVDAVAGQFGGDALLIPGAAIDETMADRVEIVVLGTSDLGGRSTRPARSASRARGTAASIPANAPSGGFASGLDDKKAQDEFSFGSEAENRGYFDKSDRNLFEGQDLDVPTYLRKGIKVVL